MLDSFVPSPNALLTIYLTINFCWWSSLVPLIAKTKSNQSQEREATLLEVLPSCLMSYSLGTDGREGWCSRLKTSTFKACHIIEEEAYIPFQKWSPLMRPCHLKGLGLASSSTKFGEELSHEHSRVLGREQARWPHAHCFPFFLSSSGIAWLCSLIIWRIRRKKRRNYGLKNFFHPRCQPHGHHDLMSQWRRRNFDPLGDWREWSVCSFHP